MTLRRLHAILTLFVALLATLPLFADEEAASKPKVHQPKAVVEELVYDAGKVDKGAQVTHDFVISNQGTATLEITDVRPACGCTVADYDSPIAPGASGKIHAAVDTTDFAGGISKGMTVLTNDPDNPRIVLTIKAAVEPSVYLRPGFARFIQAQDSDPGKVEEIIFSRDMDDLKILDAESPYPFLKVDTRPATDDEKEKSGTGNQWVVTLTLDYSKAPVGPLADYVRLTTNHPKQQEVQIPVSGFVRPMVVVTPTTADFGKIEVGDHTGVSLILKNYAYEGMKIAVDSQQKLPPGVSVDVESVKEGREFVVNIALGQDLPEGPFDGVIRLKTDNPKKPVIEIPVKGTRI